MTRRLPEIGATHTNRIGRQWQCVGSAMVPRTDGSMVEVPTWRGFCITCGVPFEQSKHEPTIRACPEHRIVMRRSRTDTAASCDPPLAVKPVLTPREISVGASLSRWDMDNAPAPEKSTVKRQKVFTD